MDDQKRLASLEKALQELLSYVNVMKTSTFNGKQLEDAAKLLKFLQDNYKTIQTQYSDLLKKLSDQAASEKAKDITPEATE